MTNNTLYFPLLAAALAFSGALDAVSLRTNVASAAFTSDAAPAPVVAADDPPAECEDCGACEHVEPAAGDAQAYHYVPIDGTPTIGPDDADVTVVAFVDLQCPFCKRAADTLVQLQKEFAGKIRISYRQNPLGFHAHARAAAIASLAAARQGRFAAYSAYLYTHQDQLAQLDFTAVAEQLGLDAKRFRADLNQAELARMIDKDQALAQEHGLRGTPAFLVNGRILVGAQPLENFKALVDQELAAMAAFKKTDRGEAKTRYERYVRSRAK